MKFSARMYRAGHDEPIDVQPEVTASGLIIEDGVRIELDDLNLEVGGHAEDRIKLFSQIEGLTFICTDRALLDELCQVSPDSKLGQQALKAQKHFRSSSHRARTYWLSILGCVCACFVVAYFAMDWAAGALVQKVDPKFEVKIGQMLVDKKKFETKSRPAIRVSRIGRRLVSQLKDSPYEFQFFIDDDESVNACAYPGGIIAVNSGLEKIANDDELAGVLGHEIGHVIHRDSLRAAAHNAGLITCLGLLSGIGVRDADSVITALSLARELESLQFSRSQEASADKIGVRLAVESDYKGEALITFFKRLEEENGSLMDNKYLNLLSTHPMSAERAAEIESELKIIEVERRKKKRGVVS